MLQLRLTLLLLALLFFSEDAKSQSQFLYSISDFPLFVGVHPLGAERVILVQRSDEFPVKIINPATQEILARLVRKGRGPGEFTGIVASTFDPVHRVLFLAGGGKSAASSWMRKVKSFPKRKPS